MNIALVILHADPSRGGAERYTVDLATALSRAGHEVSLLATSFADGIDVRQVKLDAHAISRRGRYRRFLDSLDRHLGQHRYDIVHAMLPVRQCDVYHPHAGLAVDSISAGHEKYDGLRRTVTQVANRFNRKRRSFAGVERELLNSSHPPTVLCLSEYVKSAMRRHYALPQEKLATLFNAVDLVRFDPSARPGTRQELRGRFTISEDRIVALIIAQDYQRKGLAQAISALSGVDPRLILLVVGKQDPAPYARLASEKRVSDCVIFAPATDDPYAFYAAADFFVLPTRHDPCSLVVLEALAMGKPVISTRFNGACEIMTDGVHGFVLNDPRDVATLSQKYLALMDDTARQKMSVACMELRASLSQENHVRQLVEIYRRKKG